MYTPLSHADHYLLNTAPQAAPNSQKYRTCLPPPSAEPQDLPSLLRCPPIKF